MYDWERMDKKSRGKQKASTLRLSPIAFTNTVIHLRMSYHSELDLPVTGQQLRDAKLAKYFTKFREVLI